MSRPLKVLMVEDNPDDTELLVRELRRAGFDPDWTRVDTEESYLASLRADLDIILSDFALPTFSGSRALELLLQSGLDIPFIIVSGTIGEDAAVAAMRQGAADYLLKDRLTRLGTAIEHALDKARLRRERKQAETALRQNEEALKLFRKLVDQSSDTFEVIDPETGRFLDVNASGPADVGMTREEYLALRLFDIDPRVDPALWPQWMERMRRGGAITGEGCHRRKDGTTFPVEYHAKLVKLDRQYVVAVVRDITARVQAEARERELVGMLDRAHDAIIVCDIDSNRITYWNHGAERLYGWLAADAIDRDMAQLLFTDLNAATEVTAQLLKAGEWQGEYRQKTKSGGKLTVGGHVTLISGADGAPKSALTINIDLTEQKSLQAQFLRAQRMEGIGTLASGVAHDLNNILAPIMMAAPMLHGDMPAAMRDELIDAIQVNAQRGSDIVRQVLTFARGVEGKRVLVQPVHLIREMSAIARQTFPKPITVTTRYAEALSPVDGDPTQLHQVLLNLCVNARDAMPDGGELVISAENFTVDEEYAAMVPEAKVGPYVVITVSDSGSGIPRDIIDKIFDPFFTTKELGKGTGLGLSTVIGIIRSHGGFLTVESEVGRGTAFKVFLPRSSGAATEAEAPVESEELESGHGELILVVEDERSIAKITKTMLERHGYKAILAADGTEALTCFVQNKIDAVLTDVAMPFMDGAALSRAIRKMSPQTPVIATTGGQCDAAREAELKSLGIKTVMKKPFTINQLLTAIRDALGSTHPP